MRNRHSFLGGKQKKERKRKKQRKGKQRHAKGALGEFCIWDLEFPGTAC